jgi:CheY-like chemotaxis protein/HPt (histidine-containing phosphotransfer) domain-containing protein
VISKDSKPSPQDFPQDLNLAIDLPLEILVVEDNPVNQEILLLMLEQIGCIAEVVNNGSEAVEAIQLKSYDVVFMDMQMPVMDGLSATKNIRKLPVHQPWIIGLSADTFTESHNAALSAGMNEYLAKPFLLEDLLEALQRIKKNTPTAITAEVLTEAITIQPVSESLNMQTIKSLENSVGSEDLSRLIDSYIKHAEITIAKMQTALSKNDFADIQLENHALKGTSGNFGASELFKLCQSLEFLCRVCIDSDHPIATDSQKIAIAIQKIENEYHQVCQALGRLRKP